MSFHPCCGGSLQTGTKIVAVLQIIGSVCMVIASLVLVVGSAIIGAVVNTKVNGTSIFDLGLTTNSSNHLHLNVSGSAHDHTGEHVASAITIFLAVLSVLALIVSVCSLLMAVLLYVGAKQRNATKCRIWLIVRFILMLIAFVSCIGEASHTGVSSVIYGYGVEFVLNFYCMWVVYAFLSELREEEDASMRRSMYTNK